MKFYELRYTETDKLIFASADQSDVTLFAKEKAKTKPVSISSVLVMNRGTLYMDRKELARFAPDGKGKITTTIVG